MASDAGQAEEAVYVREGMMTKNCLQCGKQFEAKRYGRTQEYCSPACKQKAFRALRKSGLEGMTPETEKRDTKPLNYNDDLEHIRNTHGPAWRQLNDVTWKYERDGVIAYAMQVASAGTAWVGRIEDKSVGPTTLAKARQGVEALIRGNPDQTFKRVSDPIANLNRMAASFIA